MILSVMLFLWLCFLYLVHFQYDIKSSQFAITVTFCNKKPTTFCDKLLSHFVITSQIVIKCHYEINVKPHA